MMRLYIFYFDEQRSVKRLPLTVWQRISTDNIAMPVFANQSVGFAFAYVEVKDRQPIHCARIDGVYCHFDQKGKLQENELPPFDLITELFPRSQVVVELAPYIKKRGYMEKYRWQIDECIKHEILRHIWCYR